MRAYKVYKDARGKVKAIWADMVGNPNETVGHAWATAVLPLAEIGRGECVGIIEKKKVEEAYRKEHGTA